MGGGICVGVLVVAALIFMSQLMNEVEQFQEQKVGYNEPVFTIYFNHSCLSFFWLVAVVAQPKMSLWAGWNALLAEKDWSHMQGARIAFILCILYFVPNVGWAAGLGAGSITLFTLIAQSMSGWVLIIDCCVRRRWPNRVQVLSVCLSLAGVLIVSLDELGFSDPVSSSNNGQAQAVLWALVFTVGTAIFEVYWGLHFTNQDSVRSIMATLGAMGLINTAIIWPFLFTTQMFGISTEPFHLPRERGGVLCVLGVGFLATLYNFAFMGALSVTSPLFVTVGMLLLLPTSMAMDMILTGTSGIGSTGYVGCVFIICGFFGSILDEQQQHNPSPKIAYAPVSTISGGGQRDAELEVIELARSPKK